MAFLNPSLTLPQFGKQYSPGEQLHDNVTPGVIGLKTPTQRQVAPLNVNMATSVDVANVANTWAGAPAPVDPYAAWGGKAAYNNLVSGFDTQKNSIFGSVGDATANTGISLGNSILDFLDSMRVGQQGVDNRGVNNELAKQRGTADVYSGVNRGIQSGGVSLSNKNANDSSAAGQIAKAYGDIGQRQLSNIGNQYETENGEIDQAQAMLDMQEASGIRNIKGTKDQAVNSIVTAASDKLAALDAAIATANLPQRIALDAEKQRIRNQVIGDLSKYDSQLTSGVEGINPTDRNARIAEATRRGSLGQANPLQFDYQTEAPAQFSNTGPYASNLPIFNYRKPVEV